MFDFVGEIIKALNLVQDLLKLKFLTKSVDIFILSYLEFKLLFVRCLCFSFIGISAYRLWSPRLYLQRDTFYRLYSFYCQNIPRSDRLRETLVDTHLFLQECQKRLGHKLPLGAYLLKPVQRITKYKLLLENLLSSSDSGSCTKELQKALDCMLIVLRCVNDSMHQVAITGFPVSKFA